MKIKTFEQEPFMDGGEKLRDLPGEPSRSKVENRFGYWFSCGEDQEIKQGIRF